MGQQKILSEAEVETRNEFQQKMEQLRRVTAVGVMMWKDHPEVLASVLEKLNIDQEYFYNAVIELADYYEDTVKSYFESKSIGGDG